MLSTDRYCLAMSMQLTKCEPTANDEVEAQVKNADPTKSQSTVKEEVNAQVEKEDPYMVLPVDSSEEEKDRIAEYRMERLARQAEYWRKLKVPKVETADVDEETRPVVEMANTADAAEEEREAVTKGDTVEEGEPDDPREVEWYRKRDNDNTECGDETVYIPWAPRKFLDAPWREKPKDAANIEAASSSGHHAGPPPQKSRCGFETSQGKGKETTCQDYAAWQCTAKRCKKHCPEPETCASHSVQKDLPRSVNRNPGRGFLSRMHAKGLQTPPYKHWNQWRTDK